MDFKRVKLLIVDMDNTLCDTFHTLTKSQWEKVAQGFEKKGKKTYARKIRSSLGKASFIHTLSLIGMSEAEKRFAVKIYDDVDISTLRLFPDAKALLNLAIPKVLVTRGEPVLQRRKIKHLGLKPHFSKIYYVNTFGSKKECFQRIGAQHKLPPTKMLVIGDRIEEEIKDARALGIPCVLVRRPDWPIHGLTKPDLTVRSLDTLTDMLQGATHKATKKSTI